MAKDDPVHQSRSNIVWKQHLQSGLNVLHTQKQWPSDITVLWQQREFDHQHVDARVVRWVHHSHSDRNNKPQGEIFYLFGKIKYFGHGPDATLWWLDLSLSACRSVVIYLWIRNRKQIWHVVQACLAWGIKENNFCWLPHQIQSTILCGALQNSFACYVALNAPSQLCFPHNWNEQWAVLKFKRVFTFGLFFCLAPFHPTNACTCFKSVS